MTLAQMNLLLQEKAFRQQKEADFVCPSSTPVAERRNMLYSGCFVSSGTGKAVVTAGRKQHKSLDRSQKKNYLLLKKILHLFRKNWTAWEKVITVLGAAAAFVVFAIQIIGFAMSHTMNWETVSDAFITSIVLIVAAVPEGLPTIVAVSLALNIIKMSRENALVKKMIACETVGCINIICSDKTGTLTENKMTVQQIYAKGEMLEPEKLTDVCLLENFCINSNANVTTEEGKDSFIGNPTECALLVAARKAGWDYTKKRRGRYCPYFPFSSQKKDMSTILRTLEGYMLYVKGNPEKILKLSSSLPEEEKKVIEEKITSFQSCAGRILVFAHKKLDQYTGEESQEELENRPGL